MQQERARQPQAGSARRPLLRGLTGVVAPVVFIAGALLLQMAPDLLDDFPRRVVWGLSIAGALATAAVTVFLEPLLNRGRRPVAAAYKPPPIELPPKSLRFTGHSALMSRLRRRFRAFPRSGVRAVLDLPARIGGRAARSTPLVIVINGIPGTGKTQVAIQIAHDVVDRFPDGVRWVELSGYQDSADAGAPEATDPGLAREIGKRLQNLFGFGTQRADSEPVERSAPRLPKSAPRSTEKVLESLVHSMQGRIPSGATLEELSRTWRGLIYGKRILIVLDNAKDAAQVEPLIPSGSGCAVIITSRRTLSRADFEYEAYELGELSQSEGEELLDRIAEPDLGESPEEAARIIRDRAAIVRRCGGLPLAIRLCGGRLLDLADPSPREVLAELDDIARSPLLGGRHGFASSFAFSLQLCEPQQRLLLKRIADSDLDKFSDWSAAVLLGVPRDTAGGLIDGLVRRYLLLPTESNETGESTYRVHDLVRETLRMIDAREFDLTQWERDNWGETGDREVARRLVSAYTWLAEQAAAEVTRTHDPAVLAESTDLTPPRELRLVPAGRPRQWLSQERESLMMCMRLAEDHDLPELGWRLAHAFAALCQVWQVYWADWDEATCTELRMAYRVGDRLAGGLAHLDRAEIAGKMGDYEAGIDDAETAQRVFEQIGGQGGGTAGGGNPPHWRARAWRSLGVNLQRRGHLDAGAESLNKAERTFVEQGDDWWRARVLRDLAEVHAQWGRRRSDHYPRDRAPARAPQRPEPPHDDHQHRRAQALLRLACMIFRYEGDWEEYSNARIALAETLAARGRELNAWFMLDEIRRHYLQADEHWYTARCQRAMAELDTRRLDEQYAVVEFVFSHTHSEKRRQWVEGYVTKEAFSVKPKEMHYHWVLRNYGWRELEEWAPPYLGEYHAAQRDWFAALPLYGRESLRAAARQRREWSVQRRITMLTEASEALGGMGDTWGKHRSELALGRVRLYAGQDVDVCARTMRAAAEGFGELGDQLWHARSHRAAAEALAASGHPRHALVDAERAYTAFQRLGDRIGRVGAQVLYGRILDETGNTADAVGHLTAARDAADDEGLVGHTREADHLLARIQGGPRAQKPLFPRNRPAPGAPPAGRTIPVQQGEGAGEPGSGSDAAAPALGGSGQPETARDSGGSGQTREDREAGEGPVDPGPDPDGQADRPPRQRSGDGTGAGAAPETESAADDPP
ncbi:NB-ARC domain-containing protein [Streptomonospora salina]|uniref:Tetratricopeptide (TPR) repeat protein n=1 Tax=Streptomonospora salina TaxID=104205 RepID=A0A841E2N8_9ACTN|nr:NB-ARC domain-containing protein [Streptomonospora salina]MBB5997415.1 tetratricopeptide (TPR) repeat protein [Streptomonospora salina]